jgi:hypothetical protein
MRLFREADRGPFLSLCENDVFGDISVALLRDGSVTQSVTFAYVPRINVPIQPDLLLLLKLRILHIPFRAFQLISTI